VILVKEIGNTLTFTYQYTITSDIFTKENMGNLNDLIVISEDKF